VLHTINTIDDAKIFVFADCWKVGKGLCKDDKAQKLDFDSVMQNMEE
jgi:hypothetical protein